MSEQKKQNLTDPSVRKRFVTYKEATELYSMGLTRIQEHAKIAGATYKMGNTGGRKGCHFGINTPKTKAGERQVPMLGFMREAFEIAH